MTWATFGTNTQTEHHLFPTVPFRYLPDITPVIQEVSEKHNVNFRAPYDSFLTVFRLYLDRVVYLSKPQPPAAVDKAPAASSAVPEVPPTVVDTTPAASSAVPEVATCV